MFTGRIVEIVRNQPSPEELTVLLEITNDEAAVVAERKLAFPLTVSGEEMTAELKNVVAAFSGDFEIAEKTRLHEEANLSADQLKNELENTIL